MKDQPVTQWCSGGLGRSTRTLAAVSAAIATLLHLEPAAVAAGLQNGLAPSTASAVGDEVLYSIPQQNINQDRFTGAPRKFQAASAKIAGHPKRTYAYAVSNVVDRSVASAPGNVTYTVKLANTGNGPLTGITLSGTRGQGSAASDLNLQGPSGDDGTKGVLDSGEIWTFTATLPVSQAQIDNGSRLVGTVAVSTRETVGRQVASATTTINQAPLLTIVESSDASGATSPNQPITRFYVAFNTGNVTIRNVKIKDMKSGTGKYLHDGPEALQSDASPLGDSTDSLSDGIWDSLAPGDSVVFSRTTVAAPDDAISQR